MNKIEDPARIRRVPFLFPLCFFIAGIVHFDLFRHVALSLFTIGILLAAPGLIRHFSSHGPAASTLWHTVSPHRLTASLLLVAFAIGITIGSLSRDDRTAGDLHANRQSTISRYAERTLSPPLAGFVRSVLLGERSAISHTDKNLYRKSGLTHLLAVSGLHVGILSLIFYFSGRLVFRESPYTFLMAAAATGIYVVGIGMPASATRAGIMSIAMLAGASIGRRSDLINVLAAAAFVTLIFDPSSVLDVGFQLSYAATFGLVMWTDRITKFLPSRPPLFWGLVSATTAAQAMTLPVSLWHFESFAPISFLANLVAIPVFSLLLVLSLGALIGVPGASFFAESALNSLRFTCDLFSSMPGSAVSTGRPPIAVVILLLGLGALPLIRSARSKYSAALGLTATIFIFL